jgi:hypothetical protein
MSDLGWLNIQLGGELPRSALAELIRAIECDLSNEDVDDPADADSESVPLHLSGEGDYPTYLLAFCKKYDLSISWCHNPTFGSENSDGFFWEPGLHELVYFACDTQGHPTLTVPDIRAVMGQSHDPVAALDAELRRLARLGGDELPPLQLVGEVAKEVQPEPGEQVTAAGAALSVDEVKGILKALAEYAGTDVDQPAASFRHAWANLYARLEGKS